MNDVINKWHEFVTNSDTTILDGLLAEDAVFHSPVVWSPQEGKQITKMYLMSAGMVMKDFSYNKEVITEKHAVLEFTAKIDDITVNGVDIITINEASKISEFKVMIRPLKAVNKIHEKMGEMLQKMNG